MASQNPILEASKRHPKSSERTFEYGTAGVSLVVLNDTEVNAILNSHYSSA